MNRLRYRHELEEEYLEIRDKLSEELREEIDKLIRHYEGCYIVSSLYYRSNLQYILDNIHKPLLVHKLHKFNRDELCLTK